jgi:large subunit ribosomal protein L9
MKVILLTDIPKVGKKYDIKEFADGYARNVLIAKGLAELATPHAISLVENKKKSIQKKQEEEVSLLSGIVDDVKNKGLVLKMNANNKGHLFSSVSVKDIHRLIKDTHNHDIEENLIIIDKPIREIGLHVFKIKKGGFESECSLSVESI